MLLAKIKKTKAYATLGALLTVIAVCLGLVQAVPALAAASFCCSGSFTVAPGDPSAVTLTVTSYATESLDVVVIVTTPSANGSSQLVETVQTQPATDPTPDIPGDANTPWTGPVGSFTVPAGATITATIGGTPIAPPYTNPAITPDPVLAVPPAPPNFVDKPGKGQDGVTLPSAGCWVYKVNGTDYAAGTFVSITGPVTVTATLAAGCVVRPNTDTAYTWSQTLSGDGDKPADDGDTKKVAFCHATGSATNPYVLIETSVNAFYNAGHIDHTGDIWAAFSYWKGGVEYPVAARGDQSILASGCVIEAGHPEPNPHNPGPVTDPEPKPEPKPEPHPAPAPAPAPAPQAAPAPVLAPVGNAAPQVQAPVQSEAPAVQDNEVVSLTADTAAGTSGPDYIPSFLFGGAGLILFALAFARRREQGAAK